MARQQAIWSTQRQVVFSDGVSVRVHKQGDQDLCPACGAPTCSFGLDFDPEGVANIGLSGGGDYDYSCPICHLSLEWETLFDRSKVLVGTADQEDWRSHRLALVAEHGRTIEVWRQLAAIDRLPEFAGGPLPDGVPPVVAATAHGDAAAVYDLLANGHGVESVDPDGWTALHWAAALGLEDLVSHLVGAGAVVDAGNSRGESPLVLAAALANDATARRLISLGANVNARTTQSYRVSWGAGECDPVNVPSLRTALHNAAGCGDERKVRVLCQASAQVDAADDEGTTPLMLASNVAAADALLEFGASVNAADGRSWQATHFAARHGRLDVLSRLASAGANLQALTNTRTGHTVLTCAVEKRPGKDALGLVNWLIEAGVDVNQPAADKMTPLEYAVRQNEPKVVERLIDAGADVDARGYRGTYALLTCFDACGGDRTEITRILLQAGADVNVANYRGETPLIRAASRAHGPRIKMLLDAGARVADADTQGMTPLHHAAVRSSPDAVAMLLAYGANPEVLDRRGRRPAEMNCSPLVRELLKK